MKTQKIVTRIFILIALMLLIQNSFAQNPNLHIYLCFGQSNMEGQGTIENQDKIVDSRFKVFQALTCSNLGRVKAEWYTAVPPLCQCWSKLSPAAYFGKTMVENLPDSIEIGVINVAVGGCDIRLFDKELYQDYDSTYTESWFTDKIEAYEGNPYKYLIDLAKLAQIDGVIKGILLHQGETNTGNSQWPSYVKSIYDDMMEDLSLNPDSIPLLAGEVVHADQNGVCASMNSIIAKLPQTIPNSYVISSSGCTAKSDNVHFNSAGYREIGRRYAIQMLSLMGVDLSSVENHLTVPEGYALEKNYPNPFNPETSIQYHLPQRSQIILDVMDITGRTVEVLANNVKNIGTYTSIFNASDLSSGIYFYRLRTSTGFMKSQKMLLVK